MNDHIPNEIAKCQGRKASVRNLQLWFTKHEPECGHCARFWIAKQDRKELMPWFGHGPCPDRLEMEK